MMKPGFGSVIALLTLTGISASLLYILFKKNEDEDKDSEPVVFTARPTTIKVKIHKDMVGILVGHQGANINKIQEESGARLEVSCLLADSEYRSCTIYGSADRAQKAETLIQDFLQNQPKRETIEMLVDKRYSGKIIGKYGSNVKRIREMSHAKILLTDDVDSHKSKITIKGSSEQIVIARDLILNIMKELDSSEEEYQSRIQNRSPRVQPKCHLRGMPKLPANSDDSHEILTPPGGDQSLEVFVSALESPELFWVQVISENGTKLDKLLEDMTEYYNNPENQELHKLSELNEGQIVAAVFAVDGKWYRAEVVAVTEDSEKKREILVFYVDYGDTQVVREDQVLELRTDFLTLRYQAIECFLADLKPKTEEWSVEAVDLFESLSYVAQWRKLTVVIKTYEERSKAYNERTKLSVPGVELFDTQGNNWINIGEELVKAGFAVKTDHLESWETQDFHTGPSTSQNQCRVLPEASDSGSDIDGFYFEY